MPKPIPIELAQKLLSYNPSSGEFTWKQRVAWITPAGAKAGFANARRYSQIRIGGLGSFMAHRVAWAIHYGEQPPQYIDHVNRIKSDNRIANLRAADAHENCINSKARDPRSGYKGVYKRPAKCKSRPWFARICVRGVPTLLGNFETAEEAGLVYEIAAKRFFGGFAAHQSA